LDCGWDKPVTVRISPLYCNKQIPWVDIARIERNAGDDRLRKFRPLHFRKIANDFGEQCLWLEIHYDLDR
jgi:hypothetical protein